jgi:hypothetical protein
MLQAPTASEGGGNEDARQMRPTTSANRRDRWLLNVRVHEYWERP